MLFCYPFHSLFLFFIHGHCWALLIVSQQHICRGVIRFSASVISVKKSSSSSFNCLNYDIICTKVSILLLTLVLSQDFFQEIPILEVRNRLHCRQQVKRSKKQGHTVKTGTPVKASSDMLRKGKLVQHLQKHANDIVNRYIHA